GVSSWLRKSPTLLVQSVPTAKMIPKSHAGRIIRRANNSPRVKMKKVLAASARRALVMNRTTFKVRPANRHKSAAEERVRKYNNVIMAKPYFDMEAKNRTMVIGPDHCEP